MKCRKSSLKNPQTQHIFFNTTAVSSEKYNFLIFSFFMFSLISEHFLVFKLQETCMPVKLGEYLLLLQRCTFCAALGKLIARQRLHLCL